MKILQSSYAPRVGKRYSQVHVDLDRASTVYPKKYQKYQAFTVPPKVIES